LIRNRRIVLAARPEGEPRPSDFRLEEQELGSPGEGQVLVRVLYLSLDPYQRLRMRPEKSYAEPVAIGGVIEGDIVGEVRESRHPGFRQGEIVRGRLGWQEWAIAPGEALTRIDPDAAPISTALGVLGMPGMTAYAGLLEIGRPKEGETLVVAAAAGPVGSAVGQIARIEGARAVGIAGGPDKCRLLTEHYGFDAAIDHRAPDMPERLAAACPDGIDVYFENVGGKVFEAVFPLLNTFARIPVCGVVSHYHDSAPPPGPDRLPALLMACFMKRLTLRGFIVRDFAHLADDFHRDMTAWVREGRIKYLEDVAEGLEQAPEAFIGMLRGRNRGKQLVRVAG
jgi:NADPH-dependent curcumin reductase